MLKIKFTVLLFDRHVQINNEGAIAFYKKFGFEIVETKEHYYKRIEPADAYVLQKTLRNTNSNASGANSNHNHNPAHSNGHLEKKEKKA